ncbi:MAG TPA: ATP-binding protein [Dissulfurispiraceae bacterium]|nr:ATP-binding protein [Dissulfurispiraceae bacterium]
MKIENKIQLSYFFNVAFIVMIGFFAFQNMNQVLAKLRFVEISDDLNATFLEMRIAEKNFLLYDDEKWLVSIHENIKDSMKSIDTTREDLIRVIGDNNLQLLKSYLDEYSTVIDELDKTHGKDPGLKTELSSVGRKLRDFFKTKTQLERNRVNEIISNAKRLLFISFLCILFLSIVLGRLVSKKISISLRDIERVAMSIAEGNFRKIEDGKSKDEFGSVILAINRMSDELRNKEEEIIQAKKLASLGVLTAGVAHELTNPLNNISMITQNYLDLYDFIDKEKRLSLIARAYEETKRMEDVVKNLLDFSKSREAKLKRADINEIVRKSVRLMQNTLDITNIDSKLLLNKGLPQVYVDEHQIEQVMVNLIANSVQAMSPGGILTVETKAAGEATVVIRVQDTGQGIPPEYLPNIFDPFFSTKSSGTGLGLSVSYGIIKNHNGNIKVDSTVSVGTTFTIELPSYKRAREERHESI